jgi:hypothetical protein
MKPNTLTGILMAAAVLSLSVSCKRDKAPIPVIPFVKAADFWETHKVKAQEFKGNATTGFTITGAKGVKIVFPAGAFMDGSGNAVQGNVTVKLTEILSKKDILLSGPMTESNGQLLVSGGEILVKAEQDGKELQAVRKGINVEVPQVMKAGDMQLFVQGPREPGANGVPNPNLQQSPVTWQAAPYAPFGYGPNAYLFDLPAFTWVNCDRFYFDPREKTTITVSPDFQDGNQVSDLQVMLVFKDITTVVTLPYNTSLQKFESYAMSLPIGIEADLVIMGKDADGFIQFGTQHITISAHQHINAAIGRVEAADVEAFLNSIK